MKKRIAVLVSGGGTNLQALLEAEAAGKIPHGEIAMVISNNPNAYALERAKNFGVPAAVINKKELGSQAAFEAQLQAVLERNGTDLIILAGFMCILSQNFTAKWPKRIINVHPSLIPSFCGEGFYGLRVHQAALDYGVKVTGATVHFVNEIPDGGEIIAQKAVDIQPGDTPETLQRRVMEQAEWIEISSMADRLAGNTYPGRGIVLGVTPDGKQAVAAYFIMGRSVNSRNRIFCQEPDGIRTQAHDPSLMKDPHLIIYHPVREAGSGLIVTNGDQTDTIWEFLSRGESWEAALRTRQFEDDGPNWTPRISGIQANDGSYKMSILKAADPEGHHCARFFWEYPATAGLGHFLHTYVCDGNPVIPTFQGEPERVSIPADIDVFTQELWENLNADNKISLFVRYTDLETGAHCQRIINKHC